MLLWFSPKGERFTGGVGYVNTASRLTRFQSLNAAAQIAVLRPQRTDVLAHRVERMDRRAER